MDFKIYGHDCINAVIDMLSAFFPNEKYNRTDINSSSNRFLFSEYIDGTAYASYFENSVLKGKEQFYNTNDISHGIKTSIYKLFCNMRNISLPWGVLTGIRPAKIASSMLESGLSDSEIVASLTDKYLTSSEKAHLCLEVSKQEKKIIEKSSKNGYSVYIGIPFCPSRCLYCSFTAYPIDKYAHLTGEYINKLKDEIGFSSGLFSGKKLETIYVGGGTPTSLSNESFEALLRTIAESFEISGLKEFTVEAGRPDSINEYKLDVMKAYNVNRISINPQSMNERTLEAIGRKHTTEDFYNSYNLARKKGFNHINVDLILGLDSENSADVCNTFEAITSICPEEITVHTLSVKRASRLKEELMERNLTDNALIEEMLNITSRYMADFGYKPYYMYRQKNMLGNFENVGYAKPGFEGIYNVLIMEECQSILAFGAGATSKFINNATGRIERAFNVKNVDEYMNRTDEMSQRKADALHKAMEENLC